MDNNIAKLKSEGKQIIACIINQRILIKKNFHNCPAITYLYYVAFMSPIQRPSHINLCPQTCLLFVSMSCQQFVEV